MYGLESRTFGFGYWYIYFVYNKIFAVTFDENFASATGTKSGLYNLMIAVITAVVIVACHEPCGRAANLGTNYLPSLSAMRVFKSFRSVIISSAAIAVSCAIIGILISILWSTPVGSTIVAVNIAIFCLFYVAALIPNLKGHSR